MAIDGGELLVQTLETAGVKCAFVLHGGHLDPIFQACLDHSIDLIDTRHEAAAGHAADAYARQTGELGVALATAGPGYTNILTAITQAYVDCSPVLFIAGAPPLRDAEKWPLQGGIDQIAMAKPVTKWAGQATRTDQIPHLTAHAIRTALAGRPGPVLLEIPIDVLFKRIDEAPRLPATITIDAAPAPSVADIETVLAQLSGAARPIIVAGGGVLYSRAASALREFVEATGIPVYANNKALGALPTSHPLCGHTVHNLAILQSTTGMCPDVAMFVGARFGMFTAGDKLIKEDCKLIQIDIDAAEMGRLRAVDVPVVADARQSLLALERAAQDYDWPDWHDWAAKVHEVSTWHKDAYNRMSAQNETIHPYRAMQEIMAALPDNTIVCADGGESSQWAELTACAEQPGQFTGHGYLGCLGIGMPFAIGAQIAHPYKRVVCIVGDGAAGLNIAEFDTMVRHELPIVTIVLNNKAWGMCVHGQQSMYGGNRLVVTELGEGRYDKVAEGFGCFASYVDDADSLRSAVEAALASHRPACINVITDLDAAFGMQENIKATQKEVEMPYYENLKQE